MLESFNQESKISRGLFEYICCSVPLSESVVSERKTASFWTFIISRSFEELAQSDQAQAREILEKIVIPNHPFLSKVRGSYFETFDPVGPELLPLQQQVKELSNAFFAARLSEILRSVDEPSYNARFQFTLLLYTYSRGASWDSPEQPYACAFLMNAGLERFQSSINRLGITDYRECTKITHIAADLYHQMTFGMSKTSLQHQRAQNMLEIVLPKVYRENRGKDYQTVMHAYVESALSPDDLYFPLDPEKFGIATAYALSDPQIMSFLSPGQASILKCLEQTSDFCGPFFIYITQSYQQSQYPAIKSNPIFWADLIDRYFIEFAKVSHSRAIDILKNVVAPAHPFSQELYEYFQDNFFTPDNHKGLSSLIESIAGPLFTLKFSQITKGTAQAPCYNVQHAFYILLDKYQRNLSWEEGTCKYVSAFLMNIKLSDIIRHSANFPCESHDFYRDMGSFASYIYNQMKIESLIGAEAPLAKVLPKIYEKLGEKDKSYWKAIPIYANSGQEPEYPAELRQLIAQVVERSRATSLSLGSLYILDAMLREDLDCCLEFFYYTFRNCSISGIMPSRDSPAFWHDFAKKHFFGFSIDSKVHAQEIVENTLVQGHPFSALLKGQFSLDQFFEDASAEPADIFKDVFKQIFIQKMSQIFTRPESPSYQHREVFLSFLDAYGQSIPYKDAQYTFACELLASVDFENVKSPAAMLLSTNDYNVYKNLPELAAQVYYQIESQSLEQAQRILANLWPELYEKVAGRRDYRIMVEAFKYTETHLDLQMKATFPGLEPQEFVLLITEALETPRISSRLSPASLSIFRAFERDSESCRSFFNHIFIQDVCSRPIIMKQMPLFWSKLIDDRFYEFSLQDKVQAQIIIDQFVVPDHPFSNNIQTDLKVEFFLKDPSRSFDYFIQSAVEKSFTQSLSLITLDNSQNYDSSQYYFHVLLSTYQKAACWKDSACQYSCAFLMMTPFAEIRYLLRSGFAYAGIGQLAAVVYSNMHTKSPKSTESALKKVLPSVYAKSADKTYHQVMKAYIASGRKAISSEEFRSYAKAAHEDPKISERLPPSHVSILEAFHSSLPICQPFFYYIFQNCLPKNMSKRNDDGFWLELIDDSFRKFAKASNSQAQEIVRQVVLPAHPFLSEASKTIFKIEKFQAAFLMSLSDFITSIARPIFVRKWNEIFENTDEIQAQHQLCILLEKYKQSNSWSSPLHSLEWPLLTTTPFEKVKNSAGPLLAQNYDFYANMTSFVGIVKDDHIKNDPQMPTKRVKIVSFKDIIGFMLE